MGRSGAPGWWLRSLLPFKAAVRRDDLGNSKGWATVRCCCAVLEGVLTLIDVMGALGPLRVGTKFKLFFRTILVKRGETRHLSLLSVTSSVQPRISL